MDKMDIMLFRELAQGDSLDYFRSDSKISGKNLAVNLKVHESAIKRRLKRWREGGFLRSIRIEPNMNLFGLKKALYDFKLQTASKERFISALKLIDGILFIIDMFGYWIRVELVYESEEDLEKKVELIKVVTNSTKCLELQHALTPPSKVMLTKTDWKIIKSLRHNARKSFSQVANEIAISTKTVKRRYRRLIENKLITARLFPNFKCSTGTIFASLLAFYSENVSRHEVSSELRKRLENNFFLCLLGSPQFAAFLLCFSSLNESEKASHEAEDVPGVKNMKLDMINDIIVVDEWVDKKITRMIE
jgi:DNA-binding Lrp family transcriptional regulator